MYSIKSDSYALGVMIYYLIYQQFPYNGKDIPRIVKSIKSKELDFSKVANIPSEIKRIIINLCNKDNR